MQTESAEGAIVSVTSGEAVNVIFTCAKKLTDNPLNPAQGAEKQKSNKKTKTKQTDMLRRTGASENPVPGVPLPMKFWVRLCFAGISRHTPMRVYSSVNLYLLSAFHRSAS